MNANILRLIYDQLRNQYPLTYTNTLSLNEGFTMDVSIIVGTANGVTCWLYDDEGLLIFSHEVPGQANHEHWHPQNVEEAIQAMTDFMESH